METQATVWQWRPQKRSRDVRDQFFEDGDRFCCYSVKQLPLETDTIDCRRIPQFPCSIAGCPETFDTLLGYESHYNSVHRHTCSECRRSYPSNHLLEIHLRESHDPLFSLQSGDKFVCLVQGCGQTFSAPKSRKNHMVKKHKYPANYRFDRAKPGKAAVRPSEAGGDMVAACPSEAGSDMAAVRQSEAGSDMAADRQSEAGGDMAADRQSEAGGDMAADRQSEAGSDMAADRQSEAGGDMAAVRQSEAGSDMAADRQSEAGDMEVAEKENIPQEGTARRVFSYKVPQNICFGHGSTRSFQRPRGRRKPKHWHQSNMETDTTVHIENVDLGELKDALE